MSEQEFIANLMVQDAVIRNIEIMGEAARNIEVADPDFAEKNPHLSLHDVYLMRNRLAHGYFSIDLALVWNVVKKEIPPLQLEIEAILNRP